MKTVHSQLPQAILDINSDSNIVRRYICKCNEKVVVRKGILPGGPKKGEERFFTYGCKCEEIEMADRIIKNQEQSQKDRMKKRLHAIFDQNSLMNKDLKSSSFESFAPTDPTQVHAKKVAQEYSENFSEDEAKNLLFTGSYGLGKSHLAASALKEIISKGSSGVFISVPQLLTKLKATYNKKSEHTENELLHLLKKADCLVLDDIGAEQGSEKSGSWSISKVFELVDSRLGKHTIYTTNLNSSDLQEKIGKRNFSRMMQDTEVVVFSGEDFRLRHFRQ